MGGNPSSRPRRTGEKIGWIAGWIGAFLWVAVLSIVFFARGRPLVGGVGLLIAALAVALVLRFAPWRHPRTAYWKLMLAPYAAVAASVAWAVLAFGEGALSAEGVSPWSLAVILPMLLPFWTAGRRRWIDGER